MRTKRYNIKNQMKYRIPIGIIILAVGIILELTNTLNDTTLGTTSFSSWLILTGIIFIVISIKSYFYPKEYVIDERSQLIINKASRFTFTTLIYLCLILFIIGIIEAIKVNLAMFVSYMLFYIIFAYKAAYWYYNKHN